jgi:polysaccharide biosynthesis/export protein
MSFNSRSIFCIIVVTAIVCIYSSCVPYKGVPYFKDIDRVDTSSGAKQSIVPVIQKNDILKITVSSLDPEVTRLFSFNSDDRNQANGNSSGSNYLVDPDGFIRMPLIGAIKVEDFTTWQVRDTITSRLEPYLKETVVEIRILSFRVSVLGDVAKPGMYTVINERITLTEALALAGDLNITAKRDNILLVRDEKGERKYYRFDLGTEQIFDPGHFYLRSNDLIYVQPGKVAIRDVNFRNLTYLATFVSLLALIASVIR